MSLDARKSLIYSLDAAEGPVWQFIYLMTQDVHPTIYIYLDSTSK